MLSVLTQDKLHHALFPVGDYAKPQVREMAALQPARRAEARQPGPASWRTATTGASWPSSAGGGAAARSDARRASHSTPACPLHDRQRKGLCISAPEPLYVLEADVARNALIVGTLDELGRRADGVVNWIAGEAPRNAARR